MKTNRFEEAKAKLLGIMASLFDRTVKENEIDTLSTVLWEQENYLEEDYSVTREEILEIEDYFWGNCKNYKIIPA